LVELVPDIAVLKNYRFVEHVRFVNVAAADVTASLYIRETGPTDHLIGVMEVVAGGSGKMVVPVERIRLKNGESLMLKLGGVPSAQSEVYSEWRDAPEAPSV
jgi:hypothetical protein